MRIIVRTAFFLSNIFCVGRVCVGILGMSNKDMADTDMVCRKNLCYQEQLRFQAGHLGIHQGMDSQSQKIHRHIHHNHHNNLPITSTSFSLITYVRNEKIVMLYAH